MENIAVEFDLFSFSHTANSRACNSDGGKANSLRILVLNTMLASYTTCFDITVSVHLITTFIYIELCLLESNVV